MKTRLKLLLCAVCVAVTIWIGIFTQWSLDDMQAAYATIPMCLLIAASFFIPHLDYVIGAMCVLLGVGFGLYLCLMTLLSLAAGHVSGEVLILFALLLLGCVASLALAVSCFKSKRGSPTSHS